MPSDPQRATYAARLAATLGLSAFVLCYITAILTGSTPLHAMGRGFIGLAVLYVLGYLAGRMLAAIISEAENQVEPSSDSEDAS